MSITRRGRAVSAALGVVLVSGGIVGLRGAVTVADSPRGATARDSVTIALLSPRRVPEFWRQLLADRALNRRVREVTPEAGACVEASVGSRSLVRTEPRMPLAPASTMKILTALAALELLGPDHRFRTEVHGREPDGDGVVAGDVVLVGGGDPTLSTPRYRDYIRASDRFADDPLTPLEDLVDSLAARGVKRIAGDVVGDATRYEATTYLPSWKPNYRTEGQVGPISALNVNHGFGDFPPPVPVDDPSGHAARQFLVLSEERGVEIEGEGRAGSSPGTAGPLLGFVESPPLSDIIAGMLTSSDNTTAEMLVREIAIAAGREPTTADGVSALVEVLGRQSIATRDIAPLDGSGLSPAARLTCSALLDAVELSDPFVDAGLADAGETGTLAVRFVGTGLVGELHAKTGQLNGVVGLAGVLDASGDRPEIRFAFLANGTFSTEAGQSLQESIALALATYPEAPTVDELVTASDFRRPTQ